MNKMAERTYKLSKSVSIFEKYITSGSNIEILPLTHKKDWFTADQTIENGIIDTQLCDVFGENLEYLFYGRPAYYVSYNIETRSDDTYLPVCFVLNPQKIKIHYIFPFDTGAFANKMYDIFMHEKMDINSFQLPQSIDFVKDFIYLFYENNDNYYKSKPAKQIASNDLPFEIKAYQNMINNTGATSYDSRCRTIEIITREKINLNESLEAIILPTDMTRTEKFKKFHNRNSNITVITYDTFGDEPGSYNATIRDKMYLYLHDKNYL